TSASLALEAARKMPTATHASGPRGKARGDEDIPPILRQLHYLSSPSLEIEAGTAGLTRARDPLKTHARWLGARRGARRPSLSSRVTAKRLNAVGGRNK